MILGASTTVAEYMLPSLLGAFKRKFPDVVIRLQVSNTEGIVVQVENNAIDLGVVEGPVANKSLQSSSNGKRRDYNHLFGAFWWTRQELE